MLNQRVTPVATILVVALFALTACSGTGTAASYRLSSNATTSATDATPVNTQPTPGSVTPSGPVRVGDWMMTIHSAQAYPNHWNAPAGMPGMWGSMGRGHMAVVLDVTAQNSATPAPATGGAYAGPQCTLRGGWGMMGSMMGQGTYGWHMMSPGVYRGPMAYMAPTSTHQFTMVCADPTTGNQASWNIGF
jgi:hypothetical protein